MKNDKQYKYALLSYSTENIGDEIQSLAARQFLPQVDVFIDRDYLNKFKSKEKVKLIMNGWFTEKPENWPPSPDIDPLFISFHISEKSIDALTSKKSIEYLKKHEPIGCRDYHTKNLLTKFGINAYFSGCLTLTFQNKNLEKSNEILLVDLENTGINLKDLPEILVKKAIALHHYPFNPSFLNNAIINFRFRVRKSYNCIYKLMNFFGINQIINKITSHTRDGVENFKIAEQYIERYSKAKLVITSRIHCALPCLALGTPVIFVHKNMNDPRFEGLKDYFRSYTPEEFRKEVGNIDLSNPLPNPKDIRELRNNLIKTIENFINN